jgi:autotransporter-associated beta strand protein
VLRDIEADLVAGGAGRFGGTIRDGGGTLSLVKTGAGAQALDGTNTYTGTTVVSNGALTVNGALAGTGAVTVCAGAVLAGTGTVCGAVTARAGAVIAPGDPAVSNAVGALTLGQSPALAAGAVLPIGVTPDGRYGTLTVAGDADVSNLTLEVSGTDALDKSKTYTILTCSGVRRGHLAGTNLSGAWYASYSDPAAIRLMRRSGTLLRIY